MTINEINKRIEKAVKGIDINELKREMIAFVSALLIACLAYSLLMNNQLLNNIDGNWHGSVSYANGHELANGRWFWRYVDMMRQYLSPDPVTSVISISVLVVTMLLILNVFRIKNLFIKVFICLMFVVNPTVCAMLSYRYMSPTFTLSALFSVLAAFTIIKSERLWSPALAGLFVSLMMGLYQATIGCGLILLLLYIPFRICKDGFELKQMLRYIAKIFISYVAGGVLYVIILAVSFKVYGVTMESYNGAEDYTAVSMLLNLPHSMYKCYDHYIDYYTGEAFATMLISNKIYIMVYLFAVILAAISAVRIFKKDKLMAVIFTASFLLLPLAANAVGMMAFESSVSIQMTLPMVMCIPALFALLISINEIRISSCMMGLFCALVLYGSYTMSLYDQQAMYMGLSSTNTITTQVLAKLSDMSMQKPEATYCIVGSPAGNPAFYMNDFFTRANAYARFGDFGFSPECVRMNWQGYFNYRLGTNINLVDDETYMAIANDETVLAMPVFPYDGSIMMTDTGIVVVKIAQPQLAP